MVDRLWAPSDASRVARQGTAPLSVPSPALGVEIWGVLNVTPDSFSDGGEFVTLEAALARADAMLAAGADVIDVGGESSRPPGRTYGEGAQGVSAAVECERVLPVIERLAARGVRVSVDTVKAEVAERALRAGARIINDVSCGQSDALLGVAAESGAELVLMHNRGRGERSGNNVAYEDVVREVRGELVGAVERAARVGVRREAIWLDPGIGFAKTARQSVRLLAATHELVATGHRVLVGSSRKSFIAELAPGADGSVPAPHERVPGDAVAVSAAVLGGARALRVHDVAAMRQAARLALALKEALA